MTARTLFRALFNAGNLVTFLRLSAMGLLTNGVFFLVALGELYLLGFLPWQTIAVNFPASVALSFLLSRNWVFAGRARSPGLITRYIITYSLTYVGAMGLSHLFTLAGVLDPLAVLLTMVPAAVGLFLGLNYWVFGNGGPPAYKAT